MFRATNPSHRFAARLSFIWIASISLFISGCGVLGDDPSGERAQPSSTATAENENGFAGSPTSGTPINDEEELAIGRQSSPDVAGYDHTNTDTDGVDTSPSSTPENPVTPPPASSPSAPSNPPPATPTPPSQPSNPPPAANPGPPPPSTCSISKDADGFFSRTSAKSPYVAYVPASYSPSQPMRVIVGLHGCSDNALNFAKWGVNPWAGRATQQHIGISVGGETGSNKCWSMGNDDDKVWAAVEDLAKCFWVNRSKVVVAGFSSGGQLAYRVGMTQSSKFAGILIENSGAYASGLAVPSLLSSATWKIPIAHYAHTSDSVFPITKVRADWSVIQSSSFPLTKTESSGGHDGSSDDWMWLIPLSTSWTH
jgi:predicted esterase